mmetsp:Transcript_474/g.1534  ORF Transcript_474/g.1534 Transcript_474/m.1534 type:complete len:204 (-) Transcript_474:340-951(-)
MKDTRPPFSLFRKRMIFVATSSSSTTTWNRLLPAVTSTAVKNRSSQSNSSISAPCTPPILWSWQMRFTASNPRLMSRATAYSRFFSFAVMSRCSCLSSSSSWLSRRHSSRLVLFSVSRLERSSAVSLVHASTSRSRSATAASASPTSAARSAHDASSSAISPRSTRACSRRFPVVSRVLAISLSSHASRSALLLNCVLRPCFW